MKAILVSLSILFMAGTLQAVAPAKIVVKDTGGIIRNETEVSEEKNNIIFSVVGPDGTAAEGADLTITNEASGNSIHFVSANGVGVAEDVVPGTYVVSSTSANITFTDIVVTAGTGAAIGAGAGLGGAMLFAGVVAGGGAITYAIADANSSSGDDIEFSPSR